jgi:molecular chaperone IbpA
MRTLDFSPLFRSTVGFDRMTRLLDAATRFDDGALSYPPYNIEKTGEDTYRITMAVAGFGEDDLEITAQENSLVISGKVEQPADAAKLLHRALRARLSALNSRIRVAGASRSTGCTSTGARGSEAMKPRPSRRAQPTTGTRR